MKTLTTSDRLKQIMSERGLKQVDILEMCQPYCNKYGVKLAKNDLSQYVSGKVLPGQNKLTILSLALGVSEIWLMGYDIERNTPKADNIVPLDKTRKIPLLGRIACGEPILAEENIESYLILPNNISADFALICKGDSMTGARIYDGDIVYIHSQPTIENGEIAAVLFKNEAEATLKRFYRNGDTVILQPENPKYSPIIINNEEINNIRILGKAVAFLSDVQ